MALPEDEDVIPHDFRARAAERQAMANEYRARAEVTDDAMMREIFTGLARTHEAMARELERTASRIADIGEATARITAKFAR